VSTPAAAAQSGWIGRAYGGGTHQRGSIAGVRRRIGVREQRLARALVFGSLVVLAVALLLVWVRLQAVRIGYQLSTAQQLERKLEQERRDLEIELATFTSPRRLERLARERLKMRPPVPGQIVTPP
jgi:cell division protein FtsL